MKCNMWYLYVSLQAVVVDLDSNTISLPSPPPPALPEKQKNKLIKKLKKKASIFEKPGEFLDGFDFGSYPDKSGVILDVYWLSYVFC